jgi:hypothetical protein
MIGSCAGWQTPQFRVLSGRQCRLISLAARECLNRTGVVTNLTTAKQRQASG